MADNHTRDIIVMGGSAGGVDALVRIAESLPAEMPAAIGVVNHLAPDVPSILAKILDRAGPLPAKVPADLEPLSEGIIYVAPPNHHMLMRDEHLRLTHGPKENYSRPAVDPLFRSAAVEKRSRVIGVILSGNLDDGTSGLLAIKQCGGLAVVQDPKTAQFPSMPRSAIRNVKVDYVVPLAQIPKLLARLVHEPAPESPPVPENLRLEVGIAEGTMRSSDDVIKMGTPAALICPECGGSLWELKESNFTRYRCEVGHSYTEEALLDGHGKVVEASLWTTIRTMQDQARILEHMAENAHRNGREREAVRLEKKAAAIQLNSTRIRNMAVGKRARARAILDDIPQLHTTKK